MKTGQGNRRSNAGFALVVVMAVGGLSLFVLTSMMLWTSSNARMNERNNQFFNANTAAEAATEKVLAAISSDFQRDGESLVYSRLTAYKKLKPTTGESDYWSDWEFSNGEGTLGRTYVERMAPEGWTALESTYAGLGGYASRYRVRSLARHASAPSVIGGIEQEFQLANIPIFQFAIFYGLDMEISCGQPFTVTGRVHSNAELWVLPDSALTFNKDVTAVGTIRFARMPEDAATRGAPRGSVTYRGEHDSKVGAMVLPIKTANTPDALHGLVEVPPVGESITSPLGKQRYYNNAELILEVGNGTLTARTGPRISSVVNVPQAELQKFVSTTASFQDHRQGKTVKPVDLDVGKLKLWSETNNLLRPALGGDVRLIYVVDNRTLGSSEMSAVRLKNGAELPAQGFTLATERPVYIQGHYNSPTSTRGTTNTVGTLPASVVGDAITILSSAWLDSNSTKSLSDRDAAATTVNAAFIAGIVETKTNGSYSGGAENFPRFLEDWGSGRTFTYNGSMVVLFPSRYATGKWGMGNVYNPPPRNWAFDLNFLQPELLPPGTPSVRVLIRGKWAFAEPTNFGG